MRMNIFIGSGIAAIYITMTIILYFTFSSKQLNFEDELYASLVTSFFKTTLSTFDSNIRYGLSFLDQNTVYNSTQSEFINGSGLRNSFKENILNELRIHFFIPFEQKSLYEARFASFGEEREITIPAVSRQFNQPFYCPITYLAPDITPEFRQFLGSDICRAASYTNILRDLDNVPDGILTMEIRKVQRTGEYLFDIAAKNSKGIIILSVYIDKILNLNKENLNIIKEVSYQPIIFINIKETEEVMYKTCLEDCNEKNFQREFSTKISIYEKDVIFKFLFKDRVVFTDAVINIFILMICMFFFNIAALTLFLKLRKNKIFLERYKYANEILGYINHEIRNPLNSIQGLITIIIYDIKSREEQYNDVIISNLNTAQNCCSMISNIVNDILDVKKLQENNIKICKEYVSLENIVENIQKSVLFKKNEHPYISFSIHTDEDLPAYIYTDMTKLLQILLNFILNSYKFTLEGTIKVIISKDNEYIKFSVLDTGIGIKDEEKSKIFSMYPGIQDNSRLNKRGFGIGLYLCSKMCKIMNYDIGFESELGKGSEFYIKFKYFEDI